MNNEIITNEEVMEKTEEIITESSGKSFAVVAGIGLTVIAGGLICKYVVKPIVAKIKAKKESDRYIEVEAEPVDDCDAE